MKILVIHGPNLNLLGLWSSKRGKTVTLDKVNRHIRKYIRNKNVLVKIMQTHSENKAISYIQNNRKKFDGIIIVPGPWQYNAYSLAELLDMIEIPFLTIIYKEKDYVKLLNGKDNITNENLYIAFEQAIDYLLKSNE
tara:strand:- start:148 stop:558 length:411 start_codon:yes stop_codon:yes gene_type:complete